MTSSMSTDDADAMPAEWDEVVDAVARASRVLVAIAARSLAGDDDVTLSQYRILVLLHTGPQRIVDLAGSLAVNSSTATRQCDRLERKGLINRQPVPGDRRAVRAEVSERGSAFVRRVMQRRRTEIADLLATMDAAHQRELATGLQALADAAGEVPERHWTVGWRHDAGRSPR